MPPVKLVYTGTSGDNDLDARIAVPGGGRTVTKLPDYLANNAAFNVLDFAPPGADIGDGVTDAAPTINAAILKAYGSADGGVVLLPPGRKYFIGSTIVMRRSVMLYGMPGGADHYSDVKGVQFVVTDKTLTAIQFGVNPAIPAIGAGLYGIQLWGPAGNNLALLDGSYTGIGVQIGALPADQPDDGAFLDHCTIVGFGTGLKIHRPNNYIRATGISTCNRLIHVEGTDPFTDEYGVRGNEYSGLQLHNAGGISFYAKNANEQQMTGGVVGSSERAEGIVLENTRRCQFTGVQLRLCNGGDTIRLDQATRNTFTGCLMFGYNGSNPALTKAHGVHFKGGSRWNKFVGCHIERHRKHGVFCEGDNPDNSFVGCDIIDNGLHAFANAAPEAAPGVGAGYDGIRFEGSNTRAWRVKGCSFGNSQQFGAPLTFTQRYGVRTLPGAVVNQSVVQGNTFTSHGEGDFDGFIGDSPKVSGNIPEIAARSTPPTSGFWNTGDFVLNADRGMVGQPWGWRCIGNGSPGTWAAENIQQGVSADRGDASVVLAVGTSAPTQRFNTPLTANRTVTLPPSGAAVVQGYTFRVVRQAGATGASSIDVGGLKTLTAAGQWCEVEYDGAAWRLTASGAL